MFVTSYSLTYCITFRENRKFVFIIIVQLMMIAYSRKRFGLLIVLVLFVQYISLSSLCKLIWRHWTYIKCLSDKFCRVCEWDLAYSLSYPLYNMWGCVCFHLTHLSCDDWENIYTLSYYHHQIGNMNYHPLFRVRPWNNGKRCMSFYVLYMIFCFPLPYFPLSTSALFFA